MEGHVLFPGSNHIETLAVFDREIWSEMKCRVAVKFGDMLWSMLICYEVCWYTMKYSDVLICYEECGYNMKYIVAVKWHVDNKLLLN